MRNTLILLPAIIIIGMTSFTNNTKLVVVSSGFANNSVIPAKYSCEGAEVNPPLHITNIPAGTKSIAVILHDPDAPRTGGFTHWVVWNVEADGEIPENFKGAAQGMNGANLAGYKGMCPPSGTHHYHFRVYALDARLQLSKNTDKSNLENAMNGHVLAEGELVGLYKKTK